jgi:hypothetical protein
VVERALEIGEGDVGIDTQPLDLVKDGRVGRVRSIVAVHLAGDDNTQRRRLLFHGVDLDRRGVGAHQQPVAQRLALLVGDHQRILGVARRVAGGKVQRFEIVVVGLDLGPQANRVAHRRKDGDDLVHGPDQRVLGAESAAGAGKRDVDGVGVRCG